MIQTFKFDGILEAEIENGLNLTKQEIYLGLGHVLQDKSPFFFRSMENRCWVEVYGVTPDISADRQTFTLKFVFKTSKTNH